MAIVSPIISVDKLAERIYWVRGRRVMLDADLAELYGVPTKRFNEQVKRNLGRFPADFMFQLTESEYTALRSQIATSKPDGEADAIRRMRLASLIDAIRQLMMLPVQKKRPIGFTASLEGGKL
jgi:hypothetical protein